MEFFYKKQTGNDKKEFRFKLLSIESVLVILTLLVGAGYLSHEKLGTILSNIFSK